MTISLIVSIDGRIQEHAIYWNTTNSLFSSPDPHGFDSYTVRLIYGDTLQFFCSKKRQEQLVVYLVDEMSFMNCLISSSSKEQLRCDGSGEKKKLLRTHSPFPESTPFEPGNSYYFISTSTGHPSGLESRHNGLIKITLVPGSVHRKRKVPRPSKNPEIFVQVVESSEDERLSKDVPPSSASMTEEKMKQVVAWAQRGLEGTFRFQEPSGEKFGSNVEVNRVDGSAEAYYVVNEDAAPYSSIGPSVPVTSALIFILLAHFI
ncbi:unnamed protein product, partial [Mesorhabditis belari]|uniref:Ephrin RBD domain-containing protein n=1 Tax=Mesorhabditis belari TaxID=2138241 RepID=A0AAF3FMZ4_9BILA